MTENEARRLGWHLVLVKQAAGTWWALRRQGELPINPPGKPGWNTKSEALSALCKQLRGPWG